MSDEFVLDRVENPHPRMLSAALRLRARAHWWRPRAHTAWRSYLACMCDATGRPANEIEAWMDRAVPRDSVDSAGA